jgi:arylsulfatase A-like enzyme
MPINLPDILPTLLGLCNFEIPRTVQGTDYSEVLNGKKKEDKDALALIQLPVPFHENNFLSGGKEYRAIRTARYTYVKDLRGPWLLYDDLKDPFQLNNLNTKPGFASLQKKLDDALQRKLRQVGDSFLPADEYMRKWNYHYDNKDSLRLEQY